MSPFRVPATGGTPIGENGIEQQGAESGGADEQSEGGQLAAGRSQRVAGAELSASQADLGAVSGGGGKALQHGNCGRRSNRAYPRKLRAAVLEQGKARYEDFGPTLAAEHLASDDGLAVPAETLRRWMRQAGLWPRQRRRKPYRQRRERKAHFGELVQLDGSFPAWLEERGPRGCLMHMVDDATTTALGRFSEEETIWAGRPVYCAGSSATGYRGRSTPTGRTCTCGRPTRRSGCAENPA